MTQFELAPYAQTGLRGETLILGAGRCRLTATQPTEKSALSQVMRYFLIPRAYSEIVHDFGKSAELMSAYESLRSSALLMPSKATRSSDRYSRNSLYFSMMGAVSPVGAQEQLKSSKVAIIGCGGIGNAVALQLATSGVGELLLVDYDSIEISNLTRQFAFKEKHVGQKKTDVLVRELQERNSEICIQCYELDLKDEHSVSMLPDADLWVLSADSPSELLFWVNRESIRRSIPYINAGYSADIAILGSTCCPGANWMS